MVNYSDVVEKLMRSGRYPALVFLFSRRLVEENAFAVATKLNLLDEDVKALVMKHIDEGLSPLAIRLHGSLKKCLLSGIGYHHAGLLPSAKRLVETLFIEGLLPVIFCTETFALGVNYPARTVVIGQVTKRDNEGFRPLTKRELLQMAGRAGRRGQDKKGYVYICVDPSYPEEVPVKPPQQPEPIRPESERTPESVLQIISGLGPERDALKKYVTKSFAAYAAESVKENARTEWEIARKNLKNALRNRGCVKFEQCQQLWEQCQPLRNAIDDLQNNLRKARKAVKKAKKKNKEKAKEKEQIATEYYQKLALKKAELEALFRNAGCEKSGPANCSIFAELEKMVKKADSLRRHYEKLPGAEEASWGAFVKEAESLVDAGFLTSGWTLTEKGKIALDAGPAGVLMAEVLDRIIKKDASSIVEPELLAGLATGCLCEENGCRAAGIVKDALEFLRKRGIEKYYSTDMQDAVQDWVNGKPIEKCALLLDAGPGDFVMLARRAAESLRGLADSATCPEQIKKVARKAYKSIWRDEVAEVF
ncbi:hypothetical protein SDD30_13245 [Moorella naiadis]|uniref:helicase-related protein n=1 Tax=Moorella naiadis (nom. illeg.) TaxID=3093670 RepID=UPI003D9CA9FF